MASSFDESVGSISLLPFTLRLARRLVTVYSVSPSRKRPVVLLIEDNLTQLDLYAMVLEPDLAVLGATRGEQGFELAVTQQPDVIVVDVVLPDIDGLVIGDRLRADPRTAAIPVIVLTGDDAGFARAKLRGSELTGALLKPCPGDRLLEAIHMALKRKPTEPA
jgi:CheY-like chemotaxis protein